jgi:hypothetical protein
MTTRKRKPSKRTAFRAHIKRRRPGDAHNIPSFCESRGISESLYYGLKRLNKHPREIELNGRIIITEQAAADWDREREAETIAKRKAKARAVSRQSAEDTANI